MSLSVSTRRVAAATASLVLSALGVVGGLAPALTGAVDGVGHVAGTAGPDAAFRRPSAVTRTLRAPATTSYAFSTVLDGRPVRWDPCTPIRWTASVSRGPAGGLDVLKAAVARVAAATGTTWQHVGTTAAVPRTGYLPTRAQASYPPVLVGWTDAASSDLLSGQPTSVLGMTRTAWFGVQTADGGRIAATRAAVVALDRTDRLPLTGPTSWSSVALHELAHVMGLTHVSDRTQLMAGVLPPVTDLQAGDRTGLARVGRSAGCVVVP